MKSVNSLVGLVFFALAGLGTGAQRRTLRPFLTTISKS